MPTIKALTNLNIRVYFHSKGKMPKQIPSPGIDFTHTHTRMHAQIQRVFKLLQCHHNLAPSPSHLLSVTSSSAHYPAYSSALEQFKSGGFWKASNLGYFAIVKSKQSLSVNYIQAGFIVRFKSSLYCRQWWFRLPYSHTVAFHFVHRFYNATPFSSTGAWCKHLIENSFWKNVNQTRCSCEHFRNSC